MTKALGIVFMENMQFKNFIYNKEDITNQKRRGIQSIKLIHNLETRTIHTHFSHHTPKHMAGALKV